KGLEDRLRLTTSGRVARPGRTRRAAEDGIGLAGRHAVDLELLEHRRAARIARHEPRLRIDTNFDDTGRPLDPVLGQTFERLRHELDPHRNRGHAALLVAAERAVLVEADPRDRDDVSREAGEP